MKARNKIIVVLLIFGVALFGVIQGVVLPQMEQKKKQYEAEQQNPLTHDINNVLSFKNNYMGNSSNFINLFYSLPLNHVDMSFQLYPDELAVDVNYKETVGSLGENEVAQALIYNATAAFALIENLEVINFNFTGMSYHVSRTDVETWYGVKLPSLLDQDVWKKSVQSKLYDSEYVLNCAKLILIKEK
ncbi:hypothetical protein A7K91_07130 [Paenibacillus oryzae]|uniref:DUF4825 domain-containing protein n=1 Tax=Paenibacillus oryzae TaxID=1844972 RepID=A0A1A5YMK6_9BACL|nr:DUF4825 domain-containing protein [Paenibacillus oryzae]OBR66620.1 hypothetical protein A7K91_07130 [Paenibacillus oryzae]